MCWLRVPKYHKKIHWAVKRWRLLLPQFSVRRVYVFLSQFNNLNNCRCKMLCKPFWKTLYVFWIVIKQWISSLFFFSWRLTKSNNVQCFNWERFETILGTKFTFFLISMLSFAITKLTTVYGKIKLSMEKSNWLCKIHRKCSGNIQVDKIWITNSMNGTSHFSEQIRTISSHFY